MNFNQHLLQRCKKVKVVSVCVEFDQEHITEGASYLGNRISWKFAKHDLICKTTKWVCGRVLIELTVHFYQA